MAAMGIAFLLLPSPLFLPASACSSGRLWRPHRGLRLSGPLPTAVSPRMLEAGERFTLVAPRAAAVSLPVLTFEGERAGEALLDLRSARAETARAVVHRGVVAELQNRRRGTASTLTRGEVRGGGRKPYKQKKTGRARRGSQRTPLRRGGGVVFGPKPRDWSIKINRKEKQLAISTALQSAAGSFIVLEDFEDKFLVPKTRDFIAAMKRWGADPKEPCLLFATNVTENLLLSCQNVGTVKLLTPRTVNLYDILKAHKLIVTKSGLEYLHHRYGAQVQGPDLESETELVAES